MPPAPCWRFCSLRKPLSGAIAGIGGAVASAMLVLAGGRRC
jgi:hypothetical protein